MFFIVFTSLWFSPFCIAFLGHQGHVHLKTQALICIVGIEWGVYMYLYYIYIYIYIVCMNLCDD